MAKPFRIAWTDRNYWDLPIRQSILVGFLVAAVISRLDGHEGHQPLPTKGVQVDLKLGHITLSKAARQLLDVRAIEVGVSPVRSSVRTYVTAVAPWSRHAYVTSRLPGRITKLNVRPGDAVAAGQVLAELDCLALNTLQADYQKALNEEDLSSKLLASATAAVQSGALPGQRLIEVQTTHRQNLNSLQVLRAKAEGLGISMKTLDTAIAEDASPPRLRLLSPTAGVVVHADIAVGKFIEPTEHLLEIVDTSKVWIQVGVLEKDLYRVQEGQSVRLTFNALPRERFEAKITKLGLTLDPRTHQGVAWAELDNARRDLPVLPGMHGQAEILEEERQQPLTVPRTSVFSDGAERYVFVEETSTPESSEFRKRPIVLGRTSGDMAEVVTGDVYPGDRVVTQGGHELSSLFFLGVLRLSPETAKGINLGTEVVSDRTIEHILESDGAVEIPPQRRTFASSQLAGTIQQIQVDRGQSVKAGDILAEIASLELQDVQLELLQAHLDGEMWRDTLSRRREAGNAVPRRILLETESRVRAFEIQFSALRQKLLTIGLSAEQIERVITQKKIIQSVPIRAPMDGVIAHFDRVLGQVVRPDEPLFAIHDLSQAWVQVYLSERDASLVKIGQMARVRLVAFPGAINLGKVVRLGPVAGAESRTQTAWIELDQIPKQGLQHNMLARVTVTTGHSPPKLAVPLEAIVKDGLRTFAFVRREDGTFDRRTLATGTADDRFVEIKSGLFRGEVLAIQGVAQLQTAYSAIR